jgi:cobalt-zinc-cadmium efflux system outer membrane protein
MALAHRPELRIAQMKIDASKARWELAKREWIPDPELRVEARQFNGAAKGISEYDTGIFISVPWLNRSKYKAAIAEARKNMETSEHELEALKTETIGMVRDQLKKIQTFHHHYDLFSEKILPLAQQTVNAKRLSYETDKSSFLDLIMAQRTLREAESMALQHLADYRIAQAELEAMIGVHLEADASKENPAPPETR